MQARLIRKFVAYFDNEKLIAIINTEGGSITYFSDILLASGSKFVNQHYYKPFPSDIFTNPAARMCKTVITMFVM